MIKRLFVFLFFCIPLFLQAQYTTVINSNRPGLSESPYSVGSGVYQFESSLFYRKVPITETFSNPQSIGLNLLFRTSFLSEKLEINLNTSLSKDKIAFKNIFTSSYDKTGLSQFTLAAKYLVYAPKYDDKSKEIRSWKARHSFDWKRWIPHVGVYAGLNFGSFLTDFHNRGDISPKVGILLQNEFSDKLNVITNLYYNNIGSDFSEYSYIVTGTYNFDDYWSGFAELQGIFEKYETKSSIGAGAAYLFSENLQFNASIRANLERKEMGLTSTIGVSYRLNRHEDDFAEIDEFGNKIEEDKPIKYDENRSFFGRLFSKIGRLFKKNKDKEKKVDLDISPDKKDTEVREKPRRKREESLIDLLSKEDAKLKKKTSKEEKKAAKKAQKQAEKEKRRQEKEKEKAIKQQEKERLKLAKEKLKEEERKEKERLKLEKEIKKLEEEIKEEEDEEKDDQ